MISLTNTPASTIKKKASLVKSPKARILIVDDRPDNLKVLKALLQDDGIEIFEAESGVEALDLLLQFEFGLALLDINMPDMDGFELAELMRKNSRTQRIPIIFVTAGATDQKSTFHGYGLGAVDFLYKPLVPTIVKSKVNVFLALEEQRLLIQSQIQELQDTIRERERFLRQIAHEIRTPLAGLLLQAELTERMLQRETKTDFVVKDLEKIKEQVTEMSELFDQLVDHFSRDKWKTTS